MSFLPVLLCHAQEAGAATVTETKPRLVVSDDSILSEREVPMGGQTVRVQKLKPLSLPPIVKQETTGESSEILLSGAGSVPAGVKEHRFIFSSATVYVPDSNPDEAKSLVRFWPQSGGGEVTMWVNANLMWTSSLTEYESDDAVYSMMTLCSEVDMVKCEQMGAETGQLWKAPEFPEFPEGDGSYVIVGGQPEDEHLLPFESLLKTYRDNKAGLKYAHDLRMADMEAKRLEKLANPPETQDFTIRFWRLDQAGQGGMEPQPAVTR